MPRKSDLTANDRKVLDALRRAPQPLSAHTILGSLASSPVKAPTQVYRSLRKLEQRGLAHRVEVLNAYIACRGEDGEHRPAFAICRDCGGVSEFRNDPVREFAQAGLRGFHIEHVSLEVFGQCQECQRAK